MAQQPNNTNGTGNILLDALPADDYARIRSYLETVSLGVKDVIYEPNQPIPYIYFPLSGVTSILTTMADGRAAEVGTVGNEGMLGLPVFLGSDTSSGQSFSQVPGESLRMQTDVFKSEIKGAGMLTTLLRRYTQALFTQVSQSAACNVLHKIEQRFSRWMLMTHDRVRADEFVMTQEFLAIMLGVRRASVTEVAGQLQKQGLIRYARGRITIIDRKGLEAASCECYQVIRDEYDRLLLR